jgi:hypothetical protein
MLELIWNVAGAAGLVAVGALGAAVRLRGEGESVLRAVGRALSGPRPTRPKAAPGEDASEALSGPRPTRPKAAPGEDASEALSGPRPTRPK